MSVDKNFPKVVDRKLIINTRKGIPRYFMRGELVALKCDIQKVIAVNENKGGQMLNSLLF